MGGGDSYRSGGGNDGLDVADEADPEIKGVAY